MADRSKGSDFQLSDKITFGYSKVCRPEMVISDDGLSARRRNLYYNWREGVVYGEKPLEGVSEFEVEIVRYGSRWARSVSFGVMKITKEKTMTVSDVPYYSYGVPNHFVWRGNQLWNNFIDEPVRTRYGDQNLLDLREGDRVGLSLNKNGDLSFLINGWSQGVACRNIVSEDHNLFAIVDHCGNCYETRITRSGK